MIHIQNLKKTFNNKDFAVNDVNLTLKKGEILVLLGSSGSGKSTLLKTINRLIVPTSGDIYINGENIKNIDLIKLRRNIGYVSQRIGLFPHLTVLENITIGMHCAGLSKVSQKNTATHLLELIDLSPTNYFNRYPHQLSGGEQQRVGIARALASNAEYLLMDEPFSSLDAIMRADLQNKIMHIQKEFNKTILFVTHDIFESMKLGNRIAVMHNGKIHQIDTKKNLIEYPQTDFVRQLFQTHTLAC